MFEQNATEIQTGITSDLVSELLRRICRACPFDGQCTSARKCAPKHFAKPTLFNLISPPKSLGGSLQLLQSEVLYTPWHFPGVQDAQISCFQQRPFSQSKLCKLMERILKPLRSIIMDIIQYYDPVMLSTIPVFSVISILNNAKKNSEVSLEEECCFSIILLTIEALSFQY